MKNIYETKHLLYTITFFVLIKYLVIIKHICSSFTVSFSKILNHLKLFFTLYLIYNTIGQKTCTFNNLEENT